ncbi:LSU ribosomal protein L1P [Methanohalophilus euhalobius]|jgi:large subunit ribosomal protein L1|uniref:Large ribosomal subunit protein uL1 n=1 Tax=Methanohalophilus euhalobius TaxID=51203 RepID=A0A285G1X8_9EURY|nr:MULTISPECIES: 50S ribosomal protein L1 [Methanohalophilus]RSD34771.1 MAG: large subunit ribosomal protein L1 [Methanohalophilus sp.]ODV49629.1 MAG: large subunit ribosomal protein L1 [Methanohalophilus sp. 2-GBenrich]RSD36384.1 MAG: large subunit ribosomal protein L1 [Methanohalophilus sp.]TCL11874.1 LSU ribosomal protein L1P [Methanohalophilus euhalobius]SNY17527.1 LSU ribosomal protein L1P [Methanohalophilus euhalobius]
MVEESILNTVERLFEESPQRNFAESVDLAINLKNLDMSQPKYRVDEEIYLPNGLGKDLKIAVFAKGEVGLQAKEAGCDYVFTEEDINDLADDKSRARSIANECDFFIAEVQYMPLIGKTLGAILGPRGKMPVPLTPDKNVADMIKSSKNSIRIRSKDKLTFHVAVGRRDMDAERIAENIENIVNRVESVLDKGKQNLKSIYVTTTMGKSLRVV